MHIKSIIMIALLISFFISLGIYELNAGGIGPPPPPEDEGACCAVIDNEPFCNDTITVEECNEVSGNFLGNGTTCDQCPVIEPPAGPTVIIPTLSQWGMLIMSLIFGSFAVFFMRKRTES